MKYCAPLLAITISACGGGNPNDTKSNSPPVAYSGTMLYASPGEVAILDGSGSHDLDGDDLEFTWRVLSQPQSSNSRLIGSNGPRPSTIIEAEGEYVFELIVNDGKENSHPSRVSLISSARSINPSPKKGTSEDSIKLLLTYLNSAHDRKYATYAEESAQNSLTYARAAGARSTNNSILLSANVESFSRAVGSFLGSMIISVYNIEKDYLVDYPKIVSSLDTLQQEDVRFLKDIIKGTTLDQERIMQAYIEAKQKIYRN